MSRSADRPFRFAVDAPDPLPGRSWLDTAREVEALGYSTLFCPDHLDDGVAPIAAMSAAAAVTTTLNVGSLVLACDYRHPAVVGRELTMIDQISGGRVEVGLGAGWKSADYRQSGMPMERPGVRVSRMIEHATILRRLFTEPSVTFHGEHYQVDELVCSPGPVSAAGPKFLIGGGAPRVLRFAGGFADIVGVNPSIHSGTIDAAAAQDAHPDRVDEKFGWVGEGAGERLGDLEFNVWLAAADITDDRAGAVEFMSEAFGVEPAAALESPMLLVGTVEQVIDDLLRRRERWGYSYITIPVGVARAFAPVVEALA